MKFWWPLLISFFPYFGFSQVDENQHIIDSLKSIAEGDYPDTSRINAYLAWDNYIYLSDPDLDFSINQEIISISNKNLNRSDLTVLETKFFAYSKANAHNIVGLVLLDYGNLLEATAQLQKSYSISEKLKDTSQMANATNNLGMVFFLQKNYIKSLEYYKKSMSLDGFDAMSRSIYLNNIAMCHQGLGTKDTAMMYYRESLSLAKESDYQVGMANTIGNIGEMFHEMGQYDSAIYYFKDGISLYEKLKNVNGNVFLHYRMGLTYLMRDEPIIAISYCQKGLDILGDEKSIRNRMSCHECLYKGYKKINKPDKALDHYELSMKYSDSLLSDEKNSELVKSQFKFEYEKKRVTDSLNFTKEKEVNELKIKEQKAQIENSFTQKIALFGGLSLVLVFALFIYNRLRVTRSQKAQIESQKDLLQEKNKEILDSITYAKRIQEAILPPDSYVKQLIPDSFILYKPKDIVAGDFYWFEEIGDHIIFAAADCTGHGVPGAMVSVVCHNALIRSVREFELIHPDQILNKTRELVIETFEKSDKAVKDGMDISLCVLNRKTNILEFSGANNGLWYVRNNELKEIKPDKQPIGKYINNQMFKLHQLNIKSNDVLFLFTDGYADQFGGEKGKKFKYQNLKEFLLKNSQLSMKEQCSILDFKFEQWKGNLEQIDDVCVIGVRI